LHLRFLTITYVIIICEFLGIHDFPAEQRSSFIDNLMLFRMLFKIHGSRFPLNNRIETPVLPRFLDSFDSDNLCALASRCALPLSSPPPSLSLSLCLLLVLLLLSACA